MDATDREQILRLIAESDEALVAAVAGLDHDGARRRPAPERWSVLECTEHVVLVEDAVFARISLHSTPGAPPAELRREGQILGGMTKRELKFTSPEFAEPAVFRHWLKHCRNIAIAALAPLHMWSNTWKTLATEPRCIRRLVR
jgi:hypothetical protein